MARQARQRQAVGQHRGDDDQKHDGQQAFGVGIARVHQRRAKDAGRSCCHNPRGAIQASNCLSALRMPWANRGVASPIDSGRTTSRMVSTNRAARQSSWPSWLNFEL